MHKEKTGLYTFARFVIGFIMKILFGAKARGMENYPQDTNCIIFANHISAWDPLYVACFYKVSEIHFMAKDSLFKNKFLAAILRRLHAFSVHRGESDMGAMRAAMQVIRDGHVLGIFPEGTRQEGDRVRSIETGVAVMAMKSDVPLIPVLIKGKYKPFGKLRMVIGPAIDVEDLRAGRADAQALETLKQRIIDGLEALRPQLEY